MSPLRTALAAAVLAALLPFAAPAAAAGSIPKATLTAFNDEAELKAFLEKHRPKRDETRRAKALMLGGADAMSSQALPASAPPAPAMASPAKAAESAKPAEGVTNVQTAGVDEGGIVKVHGEHLVILRRGRLFTVRIGSTLTPAAYTDAFGEGISPGGAWYDEMLVHGDTIVVIGYSYQRGGTEVGLFDIDRAGRIAHRGTYHLRSNDYYSSRNYASRLVGDKLIFYTPLYVNLHGDPMASFPAMRKWTNEPGAEFKRIAPATRIYRTDDDDYGAGMTLHTVTTCDLAKRDMPCDATGILGPAGRVFYVSQDNVFVWTTVHRRGNRADRNPSAIFRMPLAGGAPTALKASGSPVDQFSFLQSDDGFLNVLVRAGGSGEAMWSSESSAGSAALLRVPLSSFADGTTSAPAEAYRRMPKPNGYTVQNRFVGPYLLYGTGASWGAPNAQRSNALHVVRWAGREPVQSITIPHGVDRIEALGRHAVVVGTAGNDLHFSSVKLDGGDASIPHRFTRANAAQGETRSHGFFYKPDGDESGLVGLPVVGGGRPGHRQLREGSAAVMFLRNDALMLGEVGELAARPGSTEDACRASCVDWYGNARPLFLRNRVFALMGYEIVEGRVNAGGMSEVGRVSFAPNATRVSMAK